MFNADFEWYEYASKDIRGNIKNFYWVFLKAENFADGIYIWIQKTYENSLPF